MTCEGNAQRDGREVEDGADSGLLHKGVGGGLRRRRGNGEDSDLRAQRLIDRAQTAKIENIHAPQPLADFGGVGIEGGDDVEFMLLQAGVGGKRRAQVARADQQNRLYLWICRMRARRCSSSRTP